MCTYIFIFQGAILKAVFIFYFGVTILLGYAVCLGKNSVTAKSVGLKVLRILTRIKRSYTHAHAHTHTKSCVSEV